jgi:hypothetical protein
MVAWGARTSPASPVPRGEQHFGRWRGALAREIVVHFSDGTKLTVSSTHEAELSDAISKGAHAVTLRDNAGARNIVNTAHIVRVELRG